MEHMDPRVTKVQTIGDPCLPVGQTGSDVWKQMRTLLLSIEINRIITIITPPPVEAQRVGEALGLVSQ